MEQEKRTNSKRILEKLSLETDREKQSLYLSKKLFEKFKRACGTASASRVMEELMKEFIDDVKEGRKEGRG